MRILIVEDDGLQYESLQRGLRQEFDDAAVTWIQSAKALLEWIDKPNAESPDIILIDVMLPWQGVEAVPTPPPREVVAGDYRHIGIHCQRWLTADDRTRRTPIILFTELDRTSLEYDLRDLPAHVRYLRKDAGYMTLNRLIHRLTRS
jgi:CheY-like chemotaxis protein